MRNPVDFLISRTGMSRREFADKHGFGRNIFTRAAQGRLQSVTPRISSALWAEWSERGLDQDEFDDEYRTLDVDVAYQRWVHNQRVKNRSLLPETLPTNDQITPFARIVRAIGSISKTAQVLVVPDVAVQRYADGRQKQMPQPIRDSLSEMKYPHLESLAAAQQRWHKRKESTDA